MNNVRKAKVRRAICSVWFLFFLCLLTGGCSGGSDAVPGFVSITIPDYQVSLNYFELPKITSEDASQLTDGKPIAAISLQVLSEYHSLDNLDLAVNIIIPGSGQSYRMNVKTKPSMSTGEYVTVSNLDAGETRCLMLYVYMPRTVYDILAPIRERTDCQLEIVVDPMGKLSLAADAAKTVNLSVAYLPDNLFVWQPDEGQYQKYFGGDKHEFKNRYTYTRPIRSPGDYLETYAAMNITESAQPYNSTYGNLPWTASHHLRQYKISTQVAVSDKSYAPFDMEYLLKVDIPRNEMALFINGYSDGVKVIETKYFAFATSGHKDFDIPRLQGSLTPKVIERTIYWNESLTFKLTFTGTYSFVMTGWSGLDEDVATVKIDRQSCRLNLGVVPSIENKNYTFSSSSHIQLMDWTQQGFYLLRNRFPNRTGDQTAWHWLEPFDNPVSFDSGEGKIIFYRINKDNHEMYPHPVRSDVFNTDFAGKSYTSYNDPKAPDYWTRVYSPTYKAD